ncbi:cytochrome o ubiquinol oxidase subunit IV [Pusillimonas sp. CC-YST705]|uniref:Cytochrome bo(3) ubiquinol oxidase subunit 4 n=1 Tax=Mesopusillimonas faecipullorum TaxID=2755040 RepID=A0ABS8CF79_9BURK|nr:cytochrome o ubiquinol oxidase subunit IV [Mesopusillimonas faecipullorum]MCB5364691.1 cytochrome o ubiquinol oxidase subunit IV [Mesopusillimonas faecipullorum]
MSTHQNLAHHDDHHEHHEHHDDGHGEITFRGYMTGFILSVILTVIPFWLVMDNVIESSGTTALVILLIGAVQMVVHMVYFLHMSPSAEGGWNMLALVFTIIIVVIALAGSLWVMYHLNTNMMPDMIHDMQKIL